MKQTRIYVDGVFDIIHSGHFNALRQAKKLGDILCVGINSDADVTRAKGSPLMNVHERAELAKACKWADEVVEDTPYTPDIKLLDDLNCDYCAHGDDIPYNEKGECVYDEIIKANRMKIFKRTEGVSTTEIIGRLLLCMLKEKNIVDASTQELSEFSKHRKPVMSSFLATSHRIAEFSNNRTPKDGDRIIYIAGVFDILHIGIIEILKQAKMKGDFLYVGVYDDDTSQRCLHGKGYPILNLNERVFNLLALKYVDEVIIGAPYTITEDMMKHLKVDVVVEGIKKGSVGSSNNNDGVDPYEIPKKIGKYEEIQTEYDMTNDILIDRLEKNKDVYIKKYLNKAKKDEEFFGGDENKKEVKEV